MFQLVRFFLLTSAAAAVAIALAYFLHRQSEIENLIAHAERQNVELARAFANTVWPRFSTYVTSASPSEEETHRNREAIDHTVKAVSAGLPVLKVKIYDLEGLTIYSSNPNETGEYKNNNPGFFSAARHGNPASKLTYRDNLSSFEGTAQKRDVGESYLPIRQGSGPVQAVFELYTDVTPLMANIERMTTNLLATFLPVFAVLYGALFLIVRRADRTIKRQYADIVDKNAVLENEISERVRAEKALEQARAQLEQRVEERTSALRAEIAERKRAEDEARQHRNELAHFGRVSMIGEMATSLAHELNQPLTVISGYAQFCIAQLRSQKGKPEQLLDAMEQTAEQANRANEVIRRVRGFIHKEEPERQPTDVNEVIRGLEDLLRTDAREHGSELQLELTEPMPLVIADPIEVQQVILNLAHNGIEAMDESGSVSRCLSIHTSGQSNGVVEVTVRDQGVGISSDSLNHLFDPFFTTKSQGLGMGLSISRTIVEAHGGRLWATSDVSDGTVFHFTLPLVGDGSHDSV
jgi:C4-dicarboxylate-specific signal transduction histidine kinase